MAALLATCLLLVTSSALVGGQVQSAYTGTRFVLMFMQNIVDMPQDRDVELHVQNGGSGGPATVTITLPLYSSTNCLPQYVVSVPAGASVRQTLCSDIRHSYFDGSISSKAVVVTSDLPVTLVGYNSDMFSADAFSVLPTSSLRSSYLISTYAPPNIATQFGIVADTDCVVQIYVKPSGSPPTFFEFEGQVYTNGDRLVFTMSAHSTLLAYSVTDLTGVLISGTAPIAVFSGNARTYVDFTHGSRDHIVEQALPLTQFGSNFAFVPTPRSVRGDFVKIVARYAATQVAIYPSVGPSTSVTLANPGDFYTASFNSVTHFVANQIMLIAVIVRSQDGASAATTDPADPSMYYLPANEQCSSETRIAPKFVYSVTNSSFARSYLLVSLATGAESGLLVNGVQAQVLGSWVAPPTGSTIGVSSAVVVLNPTLAYNVISHSSSVPFCAVLYSASDRESAATALGLYYPNNCTDTSATRVDYKDNDCDGAVDEESCDNQLDDDGDVFINEDCYATTSSQAYGDDYAVAFPSNVILDQGSPFSQLELWMATIGNKSITVFVTSPNYLDGNNDIIVNISVTLPAGIATRVQLPDDFRMGDEYTLSNSQPSTKVVHVQSALKDPFYLTAIDKRSFSTDSALIYPLKSAGKSYYVVTSQVYTPTEDQSLIGIVSHLANTVVDVHLRAGVQVTTPDLGTITGETIYTVTLAQAFLGFELQSSQDFSGTKVYGSQPFSVFVGNIRNKVPGSARSRDHLYEQAPATPLLRDEYSSITSPRTVNVGDLFKVVATLDNTNVTYQYSRIPDLETTSGSNFLASAGDFFVIDPGYFCTIHIVALNSKPILVAQIVKSQAQSGEQADPSLIILPPLEQATNQYRFTTPLSGQSDPNNPGQQLPYTNYILLVVDRNYRTTLTHIGNSNVATPIGMSATWYPVPGTQQEAAVVPADNGFNSVENVVNGTFTAIMYGALDRESYGSVVGLAYNYVKLGCLVSSPVLDDGLDNDCDSLIDEEFVDGIDNDGDGVVDEDNRSPPPFTNTYYVVYEENTVEYPKLYALELHIGALSLDTTCRVRTPSGATPSYDFQFVVTTRKVKDLAFSPSLRLYGPGIFMNSLRIDCSHEVTVMALNKDTYSADGFVAFEAASLGTEYIVLCYTPETLDAQYAVLATQPGSTSVTIGSSPAISLSQNQVYQGQGTNLAGTRITASQKIAVFSGNVRTSVVQSRSRDHLVAQMPPVGSWGTVFNLVPTAGRSVEDVYLVATGAAAATLTLCCQTPIGGPITVGANQVYRFTTRQFCSLQSSAPVLVARVSESHSNSETKGDPSMIVVVPVSQYGYGCTLTTPYSTGGYTTLSADYLATLTVIISSDDADGLMVNGQQFDSSSAYFSIPCSTYVALQAAVSPGLQDIYISHSQSNVNFTVILDGSADRESYSITASQQLPTY